MNPPPFDPESWHRETAALRRIARAILRDEAEAEERVLAFLRTLDCRAGE